MSENDEAPERRGDVDTMVSLLESHDSGQTMADMSREMRDAIQRARELATTEGVATVKFTVSGSITVTNKRRAEMKLSTSVTAPRAAHPTTTLYTAAGGTLSSSDPRQAVMEFAKKGRKAANTETEKD
jgi:hypothetical protein